MTKYAMAYGPKDPVILFAVDYNWLYNLFLSEAGRRIIDCYERMRPGSYFSLDKETGIGFDGVMKPMEGKGLICSEDLNEFQIGIPLMRSENRLLRCGYYPANNDHTNCPYCHGTGSFFEEIPGAGDDVAMTLSVITQVIHDATAVSPLCGLVKNATLSGSVPRAQQSVDVVFRFSPEHRTDHTVRLWISPNVTAAFYIAGAISRFNTLERAEEAIVSALDQMRACSGGEIHASIKTQTHGLHFNINDECVLVSEDSPLSIRPMEFYATDLHRTDQLIAMMAGIAALFPIFTAADSAVNYIRNR